MDVNINKINELSLNPDQDLGTKKVHFISKKLNENFIWDRETQTAVFEKGQTYTKNEILSFYQNEMTADVYLKCVHAIKTIFPQTKWIISIKIEPEQEGDEVDELFKD